jgi:hypothetical protein
MLSSQPERYSATVGRKDRARTTISVHWSEHWEEELDSQKFHLRQFSEHFLCHLAAIAKDGWSMQQTWKAIDAGYRLRIQDRSSRQHKTTVFKPKDLSNAAKWLTQAANGKMSKQEVPADDIVNAWPEAVRPTEEKKRKVGKKPVRAVETDVEVGSE